MKGNIIYLDGPLKPTSSPREISLLNSDFWQTNVTNGRPVPTFAKPDATDALSFTKQRAPRGKRRVSRNFSAYVYAKHQLVFNF